MAFQRFKEYLNDKGDLQKKPIVSADADTGPNPKKSGKPPKAVTKGKNWKNYEAAQVSDGGNGTEPAPYSAPGKDPGLETADGKDGKANALGEKGEKNLIYKPKTSDQRLLMKKLSPTTPEDTKTEQFLNATKNLSTEQYVEYILKLKDAKAVKQVLETVEIINNDELLIETLVREMKRKGSFDKLVECILNHPETIKKLARAITEVTDQPATDDIVKERPASKRMPRNDSSINSRGQPVPPAMNARKAKSVKDVPLSGNSNIMMSRK